MVRGLEPTHAIAGGSRERAFHMAEQLRVEKRFRRCSQIDGDERFGASAGQAVNLASNDLLARAVFAEDEDVGIGWRSAVDERADALHRLGIAEQRSTR